MIINQIIYTAKGEVAGLDDIITLRLKMLDRAGSVIGSMMISGHSLVLTNTVYEIEPIDVDSISIEATDLDYEGHTLKFHNYEYTIPRTGSITRTFAVEPLGAPAVVAVVEPTPKVVAAPSLEEFAVAMRLPVPEAERFAVEPLGAPEVVAVAKPAGVGLVIVAVIALLALGRRKKK